MSKVAFLFPGQGSQAPGMGRELAETHPAAKEVFARADRTLEISLSTLCFEGPADQLRLTANSQPAILAVSVAAYRVLREKGLKADFVAGHSLGEFSALVAAGALTLEEALLLVRKRGQYMQEAVPEGQGSMAAVMGLEATQVEFVCREAAEGQVVSPANFNSPNQTVIAGHAEAVARASESAQRHGARRALALNVSAPFHCSLMKPAEVKFSADLDAAEFRPLEIPLVNNVEARLTRTADEARDGVKRQITLPVQWVKTMRCLLSAGVTNFVEVGPGKILTGLLKQIDRSVKCAPTEDVAALNQALESLGVASKTSA